MSIGGIAVLTFGGLLAACLAWIDARTFRLPYLGVCLLGMTGLVYQWGWGDVRAGLIAAGVVGGVLFGVIGLGRLIYRRSVLGLADPLFAAGLASFGDWDRGLMGLYAAFVFAAMTGIVGMLLRKWDRQSMLPFGPFLCLGMGVVWIVTEFQI